ncbi:MAG: DUF6882 domain-containing protein [Bacteroidota bacterium]
MAGESFILFRNKCFKELQELQDEFFKVYKLDLGPNWFYDQDLNVFTFTYENRKVHFMYVFVGSFSFETDTWRWSWDNSSIPEKVKEDMDKILAFGKERGYEQMYTGLLHADEYSGWEMTALANHFVNGIGCYKAPSDHLDLYFLFKREIEAEELEKMKENLS